MYYHLVKFPIVYSLSLVIWPLAVLPKPNISCRNTSAYKYAILDVSREKEREKQDGNTWLVLVGSWPHAYGENGSHYGGNGETLFRGGGMDSLTAGREREEIPFSFAAYGITDV